MSSSKVSLSLLLDGVPETGLVPGQGPLIRSNSFELGRRGAAPLSRLLLAPPLQEADIKLKRSNSEPSHRDGLAALSPLLETKLEDSGEVVHIEPSSSPNETGRPDLPPPAPKRATSPAATEPSRKRVFFSGPDRKASNTMKHADTAGISKQGGRSRKSKALKLAKKTNYTSYASQDLAQQAYESFVRNYLYTDLPLSSE